MKKLQGTNVYIAETDLRDKGFSVEVEKGKWAIGREIGYIGFLHTLRCALRVLFHEADIVIWKQYE